MDHGSSDHVPGVDFGYIGNSKVSRRSLRLCHDVLRNYAYYRATRRLLAIAPGDYSRTLNGNFLELVVLDWCKLFADEAGKHHWKRSFNRKKHFRRELASDVGLTTAQFDIYAKAVLDDRNKFVAHLDEPPQSSPLIRDIPRLKHCRRSAVLLGGALADALGIVDMESGVRMMRRYYIEKFEEGFNAIS